MHDVGAGLEFEQFAGDVRRGAIADRRIVEAARIGQRRRQHLAHGFEFRGRVRGDQLRHADNQGDRCEVARHVVVELVEQRVDGV